MTPAAARRDLAVAMRRLAELVAARQPGDIDDLDVLVGAHHLTRRVFDAMVVVERDRLGRRAA